MILKKYLAIIVLGIASIVGFTRDKALTINNKMAVYPNPFIDKFYVNINLPKAEPFTIKVYNINGL